MSSLCKLISFPRTMLASIPHFKYTSACAAMQLFKICIKTDWKGFFLWTRDLHLWWPVCSNSTICLTSGGIIRGTEGHACSLKKKERPWRHWEEKPVTGAWGSQLVHSRRTAGLLWREKRRGGENRERKRGRGDHLKPFSANHFISVLYASCHC